MRKEKKDIQGHKLFMLKERGEEYKDAYTKEQKKRTIYTAFDATDEELVEFVGADILDVQSINDNIAQTILIETSRKTGRQYWSFFEWDSAPQFQPQPQPSPRPQEEAQGETQGEGQLQGNTPPKPSPSPEDDEREKRMAKKREEARKLARAALGKEDPQPEAQEEGQGEEGEGQEGGEQ